MCFGTTSVSGQFSGGRNLSHVYRMCLELTANNCEWQEGLLQCVVILQFLGAVQIAITCITSPVRNMIPVYSKL